MPPENMFNSNNVRLVSLIFGDNNTKADLIKCGQIKLLNLQGAAWECTDPGQL